MVGPLTGSPPVTERTERSRAATIGTLVIALALIVALALNDALPPASPAGAAATATASAAGPAAAARDDVRIFLGAPATLDPAAQGDIGSAAYTAQLFEGLTAFDNQLVLRPALAESWQVGTDGRRIVFHLRSGLVYSDGSPLNGADVVRSWLRLIDPERPSPLASLMLDVRGAFDFVTGANSDPASVGLRADGADVIVDLERPGSDFPAIVAGPSFAVVPPSIDDQDDPIGFTTFVGSGGYVVESIAPDETVLKANPHYWAGPPALTTVHLLGDIGGRSPVAAFEAGDVDYVGIGAFDAAWISYDETLGPQLREVPALALTYLGFDTSEPPFDDVLVRRAFGAAVDWARITELGSSITSRPVASMVPPGIPGAPAGDWLPVHDPELARDLLAEAGYPGGQGFPEVTYATLGTPLAEAIAAELDDVLGVTIGLEALDDHFGRLVADPPAMFTVGWIADYPGPNDFLGVLLRTGSSNNYGRWSSSAFDSAVDDALASIDPATSGPAWRRALELVRDDVPAVPLVTGDGWALSRDGLLGAGQNGLGLLRIAGMAWDGD